MVFRSTFFAGRTQLLPTPSKAPQRPQGRVQGPIVAGKDHILNVETRTAASLKSDLAAARANACAVAPHTTRRYWRALGKRDLLLAQGTASLVDMVPAATRKRAMQGLKNLRRAGAVPCLRKAPDTLVGTWDLIEPTAPASLGLRHIEDLSFGGVNWGKPTVHVRAMSRYFGPTGEFLEIFALRGTADIIERFGTYAPLSNHALGVDIDGVTLSNASGSVTVKAFPPRAKLDVCYIDEDFCLLGNKREPARNVQAWVKADPLPLAW